MITLKLCFNLIFHIMERLTKRCNESTEHIDAFSDAGISDSIMKEITSIFVQETAKKVGATALEAAAEKVESHVGEYAVKKAISAVTKPPKQVETIIYKEVDSDDESSKPLGNVIMKELNKKSSDETTSPENIARKKQYYGYGTSNKQFQSKLNKLLK